MNAERPKKLATIRWFAHATVVPEMPVLTVGGIFGLKMARWERKLTASCGVQLSQLA